MKELRPIKTPHLPNGRVGLVLIGERYREALEQPLCSRGMEVIWMPDGANADPRLAGHADLAALHLGEDEIMAASGALFAKELTNKGMAVRESSGAQAAGYPRDCALNACVVGKSLICRADCTDGAALAALGALELIDVKQGYAKCSVCVVDGRSIITADPGIAKAAAAHGIETLLIEPGFVALPGFQHGFIGGASFKISGGELAFTGSLDAHPDKDRIYSFVRSRGVEPVILTDRPVFDTGSAIPLFEG